MPKTLRHRVKASSISKSSLCGSTITVDLRFTQLDLANGAKRRRRVLTMRSSKMERLSPLSATSPFLIKIISFMTQILYVTHRLASDAEFIDPIDFGVHYCDSRSGYLASPK